MDAEACEIGRLPEELLSAALASTSTRDACHAAAVSPAFRAAADSESVWVCFLPRVLPLLAAGELPAVLPPPRKKDLFIRLSDSLVLLPDKHVDQAWPRPGLSSLPFRSGAAIILNAGVAVVVFGPWILTRVVIIFFRLRMRQVLPLLHERTV
ncbi:hypothetical protein ACQ4PT_044410 [Festuca glaucescens]